MLSTPSSKETLIPAESPQVPSELSNGKQVQIETFQYQVMGPQSDTYSSFYNSVGINVELCPFSNKYKMME